jgi:carbonic anhydrase/acetyltransferase-like protein (isoleucine patch superfamily)
MALILPVKEIAPQFGDNCYLADNATIVGEVRMGKNCSVWFNAVVRGDVNSIDIGENTNIQDGAIIHCTYKTAKTVIGNNVSIGHNAIVHGCMLKDNVLIGMGAIIMDHAIIESGSIIAAGAVVLENTLVEANSIYAGVPARKVKSVDDKRKNVFETTAKNYIMYADWYRENN